MNKILISILLPILLIYFANSSLGETEAISLDDKLSEALIKNHFNVAEDYFERNFSSINPEEDYAELVTLHANIVLTTLKKSDKPAIVGLALSRPLIAHFVKLHDIRRVPVAIIKISKLVTVAGNTMEYEISVRKDDSVLLLGTSANGGEIFSKIEIISYNPLKMIVQTDASIDGKSMDFKLIAADNGFGTALISLFEFETDTSRFYFKVPQDQAKPLFNLALGMTSNSSEQTLVDILESFGQ